MKKSSQPIKSQKIGELIKQLESPDPLTRLKAAYELGDFDEPRIVQLLIGALDDPEADVRSAAAHSLGKLGREEIVAPMARQAVKRLVALLDDEDERVIVSAINALGTLGDRGVAPKLLPFLDYPDTPRAKICSAAMMALGVLRYQPAIPPLRRLLSSPRSEIRFQALLALLGFRHEFDIDTQEILETCLNDPDPTLRGHAQVLREVIAKEQSSKRQSRE